MAFSPPRFAGGGDLALPGEEEMRPFRSGRGLTGSVVGSSPRVVSGCSLRRRGAASGCFLVEDFYSVAVEG